MPATDLTLGPPADEAEVAAYRDLASASLLFEAPEGWPEGEGLEHMSLARLAGEVVGGLIVQPLGLWLGGERVAIGGVRAVAVAPEHRGRRIAMDLVASALEADRAAGRPVSMLFPATHSVYRKLGYELAGTFNVYRVQAAALATIVGPAGEAAPARAGSLDDFPAVRALYDRIARRTPGHLDRSDWFWTRRAAPIDRGKARLYLFGAGEIEGWAIVSTSVPTDSGRGRLEVHDWGAATPAAARGLRRFLASHRSRVDDVELRGAVGEALLLPLADPEARLHHQIQWMIRLVDVAAAFEARGFPEGRRGEVHLEIADDVLEGNTGRFVLEIDGGRARVRKGGEGTLRADVRGLSPLYTGHLSAEALVPTGLLEGPEDALAAATALFAGPAPWTPDMF